MNPLPEGISIGPGAPEDFLAVAHHHYRPRRPATCAGVMTARAEGAVGAARPIGVLVVSMPVLNAAWRDLAFPGPPPRYRTGDRRADARRLNEEVRTISRVVVTPRYRGLGVAAALVRRYLDAPLTPVTEAVAALGAFSGFFEAAGMRAYHPAPARRDVRLGDALASLGIAPWMLADPSSIPPGAAGATLLADELRRWAEASRMTRRAAGESVASLLRLAAGALHPCTMYVAVHPSHGACA